MSRVTPAYAQPTFIITCLLDAHKGTQSPVYGVCAVHCFSFSHSLASRSVRHLRLNPPAGTGADTGGLVRRLPCPSLFSPPACFSVIHHHRSGTGGRALYLYVQASPWLEL